MGTAYLEVFNRFLSKVTDFFVFDLSDEEVFNYCLNLLKASLADLPNIDANLQDIDDEQQQFNAVLSNTEIEYIANQMVCAWVEPQIHNTTLTHQYIGTKDEKFFAPANLLAQLRGLRDDAIARRKKIRRDWNMQHSEYFQ